MSDRLLRPFREGVRAGFRAAGFEVQRRTGPMRAATMATCLEWLRQQHVHVETVLDVGASDGRWSSSCMAAYPNATYVLYEPNVAHNSGLRAFLARHPSAKVERSAVGAFNGTVAFDAADAFGGGIVDTETEMSAGACVVDVPIVTLDESVARLGVSGPFLVKLDTHGFERSILQGAREILRKSAVLIVEAYNHRLTSEGMYFWELCALLHESGFRPVDLVDVMHRERDGSLWQMDLVFLRDRWSGFESNSYR